MKTRPITLAIAEDHAMVREGLTALIRNRPEFRVVGEGASGADAEALVTRLRPDILLLDFVMPDTHAPEVIRRIAASGSRTRVVVLSMYANGLCLAGDSTGLSAAARAR